MRISDWSSDVCSSDLGGMGAYSPAPVVTPEVEQRILREVVAPTVRGMAADGAPFTGFLYARLMIDKAGAPKVIAFNVRFGDPETQTITLRSHSDSLAHTTHPPDSHPPPPPARSTPPPPATHV